MDPGDTLNKGIIDKICSRTLDAKIFDLMDLVLSKQKKEALYMLDDLISQGTYIGVITSMIFKQIKQMYLIKLIQEKDIYGNVDIAKELGIHPYTFSKLKKVLDLYTKEHLQDIILKFDEYDENSKTGKIDVVIGLKEILLEI